VEDQVHFDGIHLVFADGVPDPNLPRNLALELDELKVRVGKLEKK
ncbi:unnamed protein product, partial [marine sediment metagenome]